MSVVDILRKEGKATETSQLVKATSKKLGITDRHAYRLIKKAWKDKEIRKIPLPDRSVLCALPEWSIPTTSRKPKETLSFQDAFYYRVFKSLMQIANENIEGNSGKAYSGLFHLKAMLPQQLKEKVNPYFEQAEKELRKVKGADFTTEIVRNEVAFKLVQVLLDRVSTVLHEQVKGGEKAE